MQRERYVALVVAVVLVALVVVAVGAGQGPAGSTRLQVPLNHIIYNLG